MYISYLKFLLTYIANKEELNNLMKEKILEHYNILFNHIGSKTPEGKINESALITIIQTYNKFLEELKPDNHPIKNEIINKFKDEMSLFDSYINKLVSKENDNITKNNQKISSIEKLFNEDKEKIISEENLNKILNEVNQDKKDPKNKDTNAIDTIIMQYGLLCVNSDKFDIKDKIKLLISELTKIKEKEEKLFFGNNSSKSSKDKNKLKNLKSDRIKKKSNYIGIRNLGTICYLNSVIQQLYMIPQFKYSIMGVDDKKEPQKSEYLKDDNMLHQLQKLFTYLTYTSYGEVIPKELTFSIKNYEGQPINTNEMQDSNEFYLNFCDNIEESLKKTKYEYLIKNLFIGKLCNKNFCTSCGNITYRFEDFKDITLDVKDLKNIYESLDKYISEDNIEDYHCSNCNKKVTLKKCALISSLPNILIIHLNRIIINTEYDKQQKINSRFEFPKELDLKKYCLENNIGENEKIAENIYKKKDEYYKYTLKGVNIHKGNAEGGHYISIIKVDKDKWYQFDDARVKEFDINNLENDCYGGVKEDTKEEKEKSAYLLIYELSKKKPIKISLEDNEIEKYNKDNKYSIIECNKNNLEIIEKQYDVTSLKDNYDEKELMNKIFHNTEDKKCFKYDSYDNIEKGVPKEYFIEVLKDNKIYDYLNGCKVININNNLVKIVIAIIEKESFNLMNYELNFFEYRDLIDIFIDLIISYISSDNKDEKNNQHINNIISKIFLPLFQEENERVFNDNDNDRENLFNYIYENLFSEDNIKLIFLNPINEITENIFKIFVNLIKVNSQKNNTKLHESINKIINEDENISNYLYKILF